MSVLRKCPYLGKECPYLGRTCPFLGNEYCNPNIVINNGIFPEQLFGTEIRINNAHFGMHLMFLVAIAK